MRTMRPLSMTMAAPATAGFPEPSISVKFLRTLTSAARGRAVTTRAISQRWRILLSSQIRFEHGCQPHAGFFELFAHQLCTIVLVGEREICNNSRRLLVVAEILRWNAVIDLRYRQPV